MRSRQGSVQPEAVPVSRRASEVSFFDDRLERRAQTPDTESGTPSRKTSSASALTRSAQDSPRLDGSPRIGGIKGATSIAMEVNMDSPSSNGDASPWVGGTGLGSSALGKSGRVIERLMAENDRLRREIKAEITKREELQRTVQTTKPKMESLQTENARLANIKSMDDNIIKRRDRKIEEMKAELDAERSKREQAETRALEAERQRDDQADASRKELQAEKEQARHATVHADILQTSHQQLAREYRQRIAGANKALRDLEHEREEDRKRLARLDIVLNQMRQETERMRKMHTDLVTVWQRFESEKKAEVDSLEDGARKMSVGLEEKERQNIQLAEDMVEVMGRMKWVLRIDSLNKGTDSPPPSPPDDGPQQAEEAQS